MHADTPLAAIPGDHQPLRGLTISDVAKRFRVRRAKVLAWIRAGELPAVNTADRLRPPRWVVLPEGLATFEKRRTSTPIKPAPRRNRASVVKDYFPD
jgi:hypothetical protein